MTSISQTGDEREHAEFLANITASNRAAVMEYVHPLALVAADHALTGLINAAQEEIRFAHRVGLLDDESELSRLRAEQAKDREDATAMDFLQSNCASITLRDSDGEEREFERGHFSVDDDFREFMRQLPPEYERLLADPGCSEECDVNEAGYCRHAHPALLAEIAARSPLPGTTTNGE